MELTGNLIRMAASPVKEFAQSTRLPISLLPLGAARAAIRFLALMAAGGSPSRRTPSARPGRHPLKILVFRASWRPCARDGSLAVEV